jgi:hypothetical protein
MNHDDTNSTTGDREDASDLQQWIDGLLRSNDAAELEAAPLTTHVVATSAIKKYRSRRTRRHSLAVFAAAAAITAIALWAPSTPPDSSALGSARGPNDQAIVHRSATPGKTPGLQDIAPIARFETNGETIAIPLASDDPQVSIVKLYPTTTTERRWRRESTLYARHSGQDGG